MEKVSNSELFHNIGTAQAFRYFSILFKRKKKLQKASRKHLSFHNQNIKLIYGTNYCIENELSFQKKTLKGSEKRFRFSVSLSLQKCWCFEPSPTGDVQEGSTPPGTPVLRLAHILPAPPCPTAALSKSNQCPEAVMR